MIAQPNAFHLLKNPAKYEHSGIPWTADLAYEMIRLTVLSIGKKCRPWPLGLLVTTKITQPHIMHELENAENAVNNAFAHKNILDLAHRCKDWFEACAVVQQQEVQK